jgi:CxxC-x17-CxxC domain-containing protein
MELQDKSIRCGTCGREFIYTVKEQSFFASKGFKEPRHCRECRQLRKQAQVQALDQAVSQTPAQKTKETFKVVCGNCQRETYVPFRPITGKPVLCKDCFIAQRYGTGQPAADGEGAIRPAPTASSGRKVAGPDGGWLGRIPDQMPVGSDTQPETTPPVSPAAETDAEAVPPPPLDVVPEKPNDSPPAAAGPAA